MASATSSGGGIVDHQSPSVTTIFHDGFRRPPSADRPKIQNKSIFGENFKKILINQPKLQKLQKKKKCVGKVSTRSFHPYQICIKKKTQKIRKKKLYSFSLCFFFSKNRLMHKEHHTGSDTNVMYHKFSDRPPS